MTAFEAQAPIFEVRCDVPECEATFTPDSAFSRRHARQARLAAGDAGWDVPPPRGKGSRSLHDFCPEHARC
ncbi:hypothetical protein OG884_18600 [Streptosporangium sp. NBC_01755]|uniref:hypothetical protein n=1 Tax=unclassified Streptosporangium TaxID=2632669 RepID=UPI002DDA7542|nr:MULTISPECIES: hypothetical protein [unclassified Streptosporangium]WSA23722.1 hypothetical protein OIE13_22535 [Streptosporangium sp. NBC_01810]WSD03818.1 hypothetical protein OG884_18600 [Streptosporangium sp. NBC_01755]